MGKIKLYPVYCSACKLLIEGLLATLGAEVYCFSCSRVIKINDPAKIERSSLYGGYGD